jgi:hypothetical protein
MNSTFIDELYKDTESYNVLVERFGSLNNELKSILENPSLKDEILNLMARNNIHKDYYDLVARNIAFYLLQIMEPKDLLEQLCVDMPEINKDVLGMLAKQIEEVIITKPVIDIINQNWADDDKEAEELAEAIEVAMIPLPPNKIEELKNNPIDIPKIEIPEIRPGKILTNEQVEKLNKEAIKESSTWDDKIKNENLNNTPTMAVRKTIDTSLPKIGNNWDQDQYREIPE